VKISYSLFDNCIGDRKTSIFEPEYNGGKRFPLFADFFGQANKGTRWMPWCPEAMKDVVSCDKLRGGANNLRSGDLRIGKPGRGHALPSGD
jgi:hypothetical protein